MSKALDLTIDQGSRFQLVITVTGITDMTGYAARGMVRNRATDATVLYDMTSKLTTDTTNKQVTLDIDAASSTAFTWDRGVYDIEVFNGLTVYRILEGHVQVSKEVTR